MLAARISWILVIVLTVQVSVTALGQRIPDLSGHWNGSAEIPFGQDVLIEYFFTQRGAILTGYGVSRSLNNQDSAKTNFSGSVKTNAVEIRQTEYVYRTSAGCLSTLKLKYANTGGQETLVGKWKGVVGFGGCPPGAAGKISLLKVTSPVIAASREAVPQVKIESSDTHGTALYDELLRRNNYALLIGIDAYQDDTIVDLDEPIADVEKLSQVLQSNYTFAPEGTVVLKNPTRDQLIDAFDALSRKVTAKDQFLVFYAGHGIWDEGMKQGFWLPSDARKDSKARWLSNSTIRDYIGGINSKHTLLITDACFSGSILKERSVSFEHGRAAFERYKLVSRKAMTSGTLKTVPDKSVFIAYLIKGLLNNDQPLLSAEDLFLSFKTAVINNSPAGQVPQYGAIGQVGDEGGDFIFQRRQDR